MSSSPISLPQGGGAQSGLGEKFSPDLFTGTGNFSVPIALPPGRNGFQPELGLQYSTGSGNSPFGLGWNLSVPGVMRKTAKGIPQYDDEKDTFILSGAEDLIAVKKFNIKFVANGNNSITNNEAGIAPLPNENGIITQYRPRTEGLFARIYHLKTNLRNCWKVMSKNGLTSWYGSKFAFAGDLSLVQKPDYATSIFAWKLTLTEDTFGSPIIYTYEKEQVRENEYHTWDQNYLKEIKYADYPDGSQTKYMVRVLFNYETRDDAYSDYKSGFDIRTTQRCQSIQIFTNPTSGEILTRTYHFQFSDEVLPAAQLPYNGVALLCKVEVEGHDNGVSEFLPPLEFRYTQFKPKQQKFKQLKGKAMPLSSLANKGFELIDLFGNAMPDIVEINGVVRYWRNMGNGTFDEPRIMKNAPTGVTLGDPDVQLLDANGDGRTDLMVNGKNLSGYFSVKYDGSWDTKSFKKYTYAPSFSFADPEVKLLDLTGDGITDVLRNGNAFECFFQDKDKGWNSTKLVQKKQLAGFPNVSFADPRIKLADMSGDGMQDIVLINSGSIKYWPNLGYGNFGKPIVMKNAPRLPQSYDPARLQLSDIDGDGQADLIFVDSNKITFWINQSGNGWSEPFEIAGTPFVTNINGVRIADIYGSGVSGVLYSFDAYAETQRNRWFFLDLTGGTKPYLLHEMDNNMGSLTRVSYQSSTRYYLKDQYGLPDAVLDAPVSANETPAEAALWKPNYAKRKPWKTTLPFPVQVVSRVDVIDELSKGKLSTRYLYHHGYWDGGEREFRGFGRVDQQDTETFERYNTATDYSPNNPNFNSSFVNAGNADSALTFDSVVFEHYSPPTETRNWFHLGPVGDEFGEWFALDFSSEYWSGDPSVLQQELDTFQLLQNLPRRAKRDALRAWRGSSLRSELYALDAQENGEYVAGANGVPYTVSESQYGIRVEAAPDFAHLPFTVGVQQNSPLGSNVLYIPKETSGYVFFSFATSSRTTQWERGSDPMAQFSFTADYDQYGQARKQLSAALPRSIQPPYTNGTGTSPADEGNKILSTISVSSYAQKSNEETYIVDRSCKAVNYEVIQQNSENVFVLKGRVLTANLPNEVGNVLFPIIGFTVNYYDAPSEFGAGLPLGQLDKYGALARTETLVLTDAIIQDAYGTTPIFFEDPNNPPPDETAFVTAGYPAEFYQGLQNSSEPARLGYKRHQHSTEPNYATGWYAESGRTKYDWQVPVANPKGLVLATRDVFGALSTIDYDSYSLLPVTAKQWLNGTDFLATNAEYDYRVLQAWKVTDPNGNRAVFGFSPLGLLKQSGVIGKYGANEGDIISEIPFAYKPSVLMEYDFFAFINDADPVWVKTIQREQHYRNADHSINPNSPEIIKVEYTDGFGRLLQTRTQAEDVIFGDPLFGDSGLPEQQGQNGNAVGVQRGALDPLNVVVSGWKIYNNKGKVVEQYEPFFDKGFDYSPPFSLSTLLGGVQSGAKIKMYYDPRGNVIRTVNPDKSEQWVVYGTPNTLSSIAINNSWSFKNYTPSAWESYTYDADDLASVTGLPPTGSEFTPNSVTIDALGRNIKNTAWLLNGGTNIFNYQYDIQGNVLRVKDALGRYIFINKFDLRKQVLATQHLDAGLQKSIFDVAAKPIQTNDQKGSETLSLYDTISRPRATIARDNTNDSFKVRSYALYGDDTDSGVIDPVDYNLLGKLYKQYDDSGMNEVLNYDFKGNVLAKKKRVIKDSLLLAAINDGVNHGWDITPFVADWTVSPWNEEATLLEGDYETDTAYDALNRAILVTYPADINSNRKTLTPEYNNAGLLEKVKLDNDEYVSRIAYNAKGQRILVAFGNEVMTRYCYDKKTFRLKRYRTENFTESNLVYSGAGSVKEDRVYLYDLVGNVLATNDNYTGCGLPATPNFLHREFKYDELYRLLEATGREYDMSPSNPWDDPHPSTDPNATTFYRRIFTYDKMGNTQSMQHLGSSSFTRNFTHANNRLNQLTVGANTYNYIYDNNGNQIQEYSNRFYEWDYSDRLRSFYNQASSGSEPSVYEQYLYDAGGARIKKFTRKQGGIYEVTSYIDGIFEYHKKVNGTTQEKNYVHIMDDKKRIAEVRIGSYSDDDNKPIKYILEDHLQSVSARLDENGTVIDREEFYPYGESSLTTFTKKRFRFTGKERDSYSSLYYFSARYYSCWTFTFLSVDPAQAETFIHSPYVYGNSNPMVFNDPTGMEGENQTNSSGNSSGGESGGAGGGSADNINPQPQGTGGSSPTEKPLPASGSGGKTTESKDNKQVHNVEKGDTMSGLAQKYGTTVDSIREANPQTQNRKQADQINVGEKLNIPTSGEKSSSENNSNNGYSWSQESSSSSPTLSSGNYSTNVTDSGKMVNGKAGDVDVMLDYAGEANSVVDVVSKTLSKNGLTATMKNSGKEIGKYAGPAGDLLDAAKVYRGYQKDNHTIGQNTSKAIGGFAGSKVGGIAGFRAGVWAGFEAGFTIGLAFEGVGAIPGAIIGGIVGGAIGLYGGSKLGEYGGSKLGEKLISK